MCDLPDESHFNLATLSLKPLKASKEGEEERQDNVESRDHNGKN